MILVDRPAAQAIDRLARTVAKQVPFIGVFLGERCPHGQRLLRVTGRLEQIRETRVCITTRMFTRNSFVHVVEQRLKRRQLLGDRDSREPLQVLWSARAQTVANPLKRSLRVCDGMVSPCVRISLTAAKSSPGADALRFVSAASWIRRTCSFTRPDASAAAKYVRASGNAFSFLVHSSQCARYAFAYGLLASVASACPYCGSGSRPLFPARHLRNVAHPACARRSAFRGPLLPAIPRLITGSSGATRSAKDSPSFACMFSSHTMARSSCASRSCRRCSPSCPVSFANWPVGSAASSARSYVAHAAR